MEKPLHAAVLAAALASVCSAAAAQETLRFYVGSSFGQSRAKFQDSVITVGAASENVTQNQVENGYKAYGGWRFHRRAALEAGWVNFGRFKAENSTGGPAGTAHFDSKRRGWNIDLVGYWSVGEQVSLLARAGGLFSTSDSQRTSSGGVSVAPDLAHPTRSELNFHWGFGLSWDVSRSIALRAEYEQAQNVGDTRTGETNLGLASAGLVLKF